MSENLCTSCNNPGGRPRADFQANDGPPLYLCDPCQDVRAQRLYGSPTPLAGIPRNVVGVDEEGRQPDGAVDWHWRPPQARPDSHHTDALVMRGPLGPKVHWQQSPPTHVRGARLGSPAVSQRPLGPGEQAAEHAYLAALTSDQATVVRLKLDGLTYAEIALRLGIGLSTVRERLRRARGAMRRRG